MENQNTRPCTRCNGDGRTTSAWTMDPARECYCCEGQGHFAEPDFTAILALIVTKGRLRRSWPSKLNAWRAPKGAAGDSMRRAYYVWRMARFHGGADVTMPMSAIEVTRGDPWIPELDKMADAVAQRALGTDMAGGHRWRGALGGEHIATTAGMPATAYSGGPETDGEKPVY